MLSFILVAVSFLVVDAFLAVGQLGPFRPNISRTLRDAHISGRFPDLTVMALESFGICVRLHLVEQDAVGR